MICWQRSTARRVCAPAACREWHRHWVPEDERLIVALFPDLLAAGGVQRAGRLTALALDSFAASRGESCRSLSLNDPPGRHALPASGDFPFRGFGRSKVRFTAAAMGAAVDGPTLAVVFHPHLAPVAAAMRVLAPAVRIVVFAHGVEVWKRLGPLRRWALQQCDLALAPSIYTAQQLAALAGNRPRRKIHRLPWSLRAGVCPGRFFELRIEQRTETRRQRPTARGPPFPAEK